MNYSRIFPEFFLEHFFSSFLLSYGIEISGPNNFESFTNYIQIIFESQTFNLAKPSPNNLFVTMVTRAFFETEKLYS